MRLSLLTTATLAIALFATAASAAVVPTHTPPPTRIPTKHTVTHCDSSLGMLFDVHKQDVIDVSFDNTIVVRPVCAEDHLTGNAGGLRAIIGRNDAMAEALEEANYRSDDVLGIQFGDDGVVLLYVME